MARILVAEDEPSIVLVLTELLSGEGHDVEAVPNGGACLSRLQNMPLPDLVLLDLLMPGLGGRQVLASMRADPALRDVPVVLVTGAVPSSRDFPPAEQYQALLAKPFQLTGVLEIVGRCLAAKQREDGAVSHTAG